MESDINPIPNHSDDSPVEGIMFTHTSDPMDQYDQDDFSDDEFQPKKKQKDYSKAVSSENVLCGKAVLEETTNKTRRKPLIRMKEGEVVKCVADAHNKSISTTSFGKVHVDTNIANDNKWHAAMRAAIENKDQANKWLSEFEGLNCLDFRVKKTKQENSDRLVLKREYRCHHNTMPRKKTSEAEGSKTVAEGKKKELFPARIQDVLLMSADVFLKEYPCEIIIHHYHNHPVHAADALSRRRPTKEIEEKFLKMFQSGLSPLTAIESHKFDLQVEHGDSYYQIAADGAKCPSNFWVYRLFKKNCVKQYGPQAGEGMIESLKRVCEEYNSQCQSQCANFEIVDNKDFVVAVCSPLMKRVHKLLRSSGEIMFMDASGTMDCLNCRMFLMLTPSVAGGLPLGILLTSSESQRVITAGLSSFKSILPPDAFYGRGPDAGPAIVMTDDCPAERNSLQTAFIGVILLLCIFHKLQAYWRYVWDREQGVPKEHRSELFFMYRDLVYAESDEKFDEALEDALSNSKLSLYPKVKEHLKEELLSVDAWALHKRKHLVTRGNNTNNYDEAGNRVMKDKVLERCKAFNPVHLLDFVLTKYNTYLERRIIDVINNRALNPFKSRFYVRPEKLLDLECKKYEFLPNTFSVKNLQKGTEYTVVMDYEMCSCPEGQSGAPCKHLCAVVKEFKVASSQIHPLQQCNPSMKMTLFEIVYGHRNVPSGWFASLSDEENGSMEFEGFPLAPSELLAVEEPESEPVCAPISADSITTDYQALEKDISCTESALDIVLEGWKSKLKEDPATYLAPLQVFLKKHGKLSTVSAFVSAMHNFGETGTLSKVNVPKTNYLTKKSNQCAIPVQKTAVARRTTFMGGKRCQFTGRPTQAAYSPAGGDHTYNAEKTDKSGNKKRKETTEPAWARLPKKSKHRTSHMLLDNVLASKSNGGNHTRK